MNMPTMRFTPILFLAGIACATYAAPPSPAQIDTARAKGLAWLIARQAGDGSWKTRGGTDVIATAAILDGFLNAGVKNASPYTRGLSWLSNARAGSTDALARQAITVFQGGMNPTVSMIQPMVRNQEPTLSRGWGAYRNYGTSFPDTCLAVDALKTTAYTPSSTAQMDTINVASSLNLIAAKQNTDNGWPYWPHSFTTGVIAAPASKLVPTAQCVATLSKNKVTLLAADVPRIANGIAWIKARQKGDGGFGDGTTSSIHETVPAYLAIVTELGAADTAAGNALGYIVGAQNADGGWGGDPFLTGLALKAMPALSVGALADSDGDGIPDVVETAMSNTGLGGVTADGRPTNGNGNSVLGETAAFDLIPAVSAYVNIGNVQLVASGGTPPYTWSVIAGSLPPGMTLSSAGVLSGAATAMGTYVFTYQVKDSIGKIVKTETTKITIGDPAWIITIINNILLDD